LMAKPCKPITPRQIKRDRQRKRKIKLRGIK
jgi:hypothetical protein